ncbi:MAG: hypothetical protein LBN29_05375 [Mediterranea sp.]|nr:hypothetical protein [Mediterranea sp.]
MMKRNVFYLMMTFVTLSLSLSGCGNDLADNGQENPAPAPIPDADGMVTLHVNVSNSNYPDGVDVTRGDKPVTISQELGDGYVLESTLTPSPRTRAAVALREGSTVMMFALDGSDQILGCELLEVGANGSLAISLPEATTFPRLLFYTQDDATRFTDDLFTGEDQVMPTDFTVGTYYEFTTGATLSNTVALSDLGGVDTDDYTVSECMVATLSDVDTSGATPLTLAFAHALTRFVWTLTVDSSVSETIASVKAGLGPRGTDGTLRFADYAAGTVGNGEIYTPGSTDAPLSADAFATPDTWAGTSEMFVDTICFQRAASPSTRQLAIHELIINNPTGNVTYSDKVISLPGNENGYYSNDKQYTLTTLVTKRLTWAASHIYWGGGKLTFDAQQDFGQGDAGTTAANADSGYKQGLLFKWGSLVAFSPSNDASGMMTTFYRSIKTLDGTPTKAYELIEDQTGTVWGATGGYYNADELPYPPEQDPAATSDPTGYFGDICALLTDGVWRMPTQGEVNAVASNTLLAAAPTSGADTWWNPHPGLAWAWPGGVLEGGSSDGTWPQDGVGNNEYVNHSTKWGQEVQFTKSVYIDENGILSGAAIHGLFWLDNGSGSDNAYYGGVSYTHYFNNNAYPREYGLPVRCVK